jgi:hypothetical protein
MLVYQALLLGGYAYAHWLGRACARGAWRAPLGRSPRRALWLPIGSAAIPPRLVADLWVPGSWSARSGRFLHRLRRRR